MSRLRSGRLRGEGPFKERLHANPYRRRLRRIFQRPEVVGWDNLPQDRGQGPCFEVLLLVREGRDDAAAWARQLGLPETIDSYPVVYGWSEPITLAAWERQNHFFPRPTDRDEAINEPYTEDTDILALRRYQDPMHSGLEIFSASLQRHQWRGATLSGIVYDAETGQPLLLSCAHVMANGAYNGTTLPVEEVGHPIYQPRYPDVAGYLLRWGTNDDPDDVNCDAAVATVASGRTVRDGYYGPYGAVAKAEPVVPQVNDYVVVTGRSSGEVSSAYVISIDYSVTVDGVAYTGLIRIIPNPGASGDSGSLVRLRDGDQNIVGVWFGGGLSYGYVLPAALIEEDLGVTFMPSVITGTAALSAQPAEIAATGSVPQDFTGTGAISAQPAAIAGTGSSSQAITGVGAVAAQPAAIAGTGSYTPLAITGTGALSAQAADIAGAGGQGITGTAGVTAQAASLAATGAETFAGTGAIAAPPVGIAGSGGQAFSGTGAVAAQPAEHAGTGGQAFAGAGTISAPPAESAGAGEHTVGHTTGSGALAAQPASIAAQGTYTPLAITGTGAAASQAPEIGGDGAQEFAGAGTLDAPQATVSATGQIVFGGTGGVIAPAPQIDGVGTYTPLAITGIGALTAPVIRPTGSAALGFGGAGALAAMAPAIAGTAVLVPFMLNPLILAVDATWGTLDADASASEVVLDTSMSEVEV